MAQSDVTPPGSVSGDELEEDVVSVVSVDKSDEVAIVCGRVDSATSPWVVIHAARGNRALSTELGMRRLRRHAEESGRLVAIATRSPSLAGRARSVGIAVASRPEYVRWDAPGRTVIRVAGRSIAFPALGRFFQFAVLLGGAFALAYILIAVAPSAHVVAYPETDLLTETIAITAPRNVEQADLDTLTVPATDVSASTVLTLALPVTGSAPRGTEPAVVSLTATNTTAADVTVPAGSIALATDDVAFATLEDATVPAGGVAPIPARSEELGALLNVGASTITRWQGEAFPGVTVTNPEPAAGGVSVSVPAVDPRDIVALRQLQAEVRESGAVRQILATERPHDAIFLDTAFVQGEEVDEPAAAGTPTDLLLVRYRLTITARAIDADTLERIARMVLRDGDGGEFIPGSVTALQVPGTASVSEDDTLAASFEVAGLFARDITTEEVRDAVKGRSTESAKSTLQERYGIQEADVDLTPGFAPRLPRFGFRINVDFREPPTESAGDTNPADEDAETGDTG